MKNEEDVYSLEQKQILSGHTLAVTSVDWKENCLITCSDDRSIRLYLFNEDQTFDFCFNLHTGANADLIDEWHTLTYASLVAV